MILKHIKYRDLNSRQKERYNFQKIAGLLADYGFSSIKLDDDWQSADFIAQHINGKDFLKIQLKGRLTFANKYQDKDIYIVFPHKSDWYLFNHDELLNIFITTSDTFKKSQSWKNGLYSWNKLSPKILKLLEPYKLKAANNIIAVEDD